MLIQLMRLLLYGDEVEILRRNYKKKKTRGKIILNSHRNTSLIKQQFVLTCGHEILQDREKYLD